MNQLFIRQAAIDWERIASDDYLRRIPALQGLERLELSAPVTFFVGDNGTGKSTLLEAIAVAYGFNPEGGTKNYHFSTYDSHSGLYSAIKLIKGYRRAEGGYFLRAESFYNVATKEMEYTDPKHPSQRYHDRSHGESFMSLLQRWLGSTGVFLFDEPEAALSPPAAADAAGRNLPFRRQGLPVSHRHPFPHSAGSSRLGHLHLRRWPHPSLCLRGNRQLSNHQNVRQQPRPAAAGAAGRGGIASYSPGSGCWSFSSSLSNKTKSPAQKQPPGSNTRAAVCLSFFRKISGY